VTITFVDDTAFAHDTGATGGWTVTKPTGVTTDDVEVAFVGAIGSSVTFADTTGGWTLLALEATNVNVALAAYYRVAGGSEPGSYTFTPSIGAKGFAWIGAYRGVDTSTPIDAHTNNTDGTGTTASPSGTIATPGSEVLTCGFGRHAFAAAHTMSTSGSDTERTDHGSSSGSGFDYSSGVYDLAAASSGAFSRTLTASASENAFAWQLVALRPAGAALTGRLYRMGLTVPATLPPLRGKLYRMALKVPAAAGGKTGKVYRLALKVPAASGSPGKTGMYAAVDGNLNNAGVYTAYHGELT
jgi:hypothetical protein